MRLAYDHQLIEVLVLNSTETIINIYIYIYIYISGLTWADFILIDLWLLLLYSFVILRKLAMYISFDIAVTYF